MNYFLWGLTIGLLLGFVGGVYFDSIKSWILSKLNFTPKIGG